jgi:hypothetical protein
LLIQLEVMKVMNYTLFMYRKPPLELPPLLPSSNLNDVAGKYAFFRVESELSTWLNVLNDTKGAPLPACDEYKLSFLIKKISEIESACTWATRYPLCVISDKQPQEKRSIYRLNYDISPAILRPIGTTPPPNRIDDLEKEVESLKRQVAVLTGLVQLRDSSLPEPHSQKTPKFDPLAVAKARGASYMKNEFEAPENLTLVAASQYSGRSDRIINQERNRGWLYALILDGNKRGYRYPKWQFDVSSERLRPVLEFLIPSELGCWAIHGFLKRPHPGLNGISPSEAIADSDVPIDKILSVVRARLDPHQGAA